MCNGCFDADKRPAILEKHPECSGVIKTPFLTIDDLKTNLFYDWMVSGKESFRIHKEAVINPPKKYEWHATHFESGKEADISIEFI